MHPKLTRLIAATLLSLPGLLPAQNTTNPPPTETAKGAETVNAALKLREDTAVAVATGGLDPELAISRLRAEASPSGLKLDPEADFAFAAIDIGQRLIASGAPSVAERFFREAEKTLKGVVDRTPDEAKKLKAQYLSKLALIRANYLGNSTAAKADLDAAQKLVPDDKYLQQLRRTLAKGNASIFKDESNNQPKDQPKQG